MRTWQMETRHCNCTHPCSILPRPGPWPPLPLPTRFVSPLHNANLKTVFHSHFSCSTKYRRWDSNAESFRPRKFNFNFGGKDKDNEEEEEEEDVDDYGSKRRSWFDESTGIDEGASGSWEEAIQSLWIFKLFRSYGWLFPVMILSSLFATGPKGFLMALALPLGQSALQLAFEKLWGRTESKPKRRSRMKRKPFASTVGGPKIEEEELEENKKTRKGKTDYQSWVVENGGSVERGSQNAGGYGGWDDLDKSGPARRSSGVMGGSQRMPKENGKLSRRERKSDTPLLLRLLIAVFPFLGTWTKML